MFARKRLVPQKRTMRNLWLAPAVFSIANRTEDVEPFACLLTAADIVRVILKLAPGRTK